MSNDLKCANCGKKLAEVNIEVGEIRIKCKCGVTTVVKALNIALPVKPSYTDKVSKTIEKK